MTWASNGRKRSYACNSELLCYLRERKGWTQRELASVSGYSERLISKAEAGRPISRDTIADLAESLSSAEETIYPEDLVCDPVMLAKEYFSALHTQQKDIVAAIRHFLDDEIVYRIQGDPAEIPFAGEHRGIAAVERAYEIFFSLLEVPEGYDHDAGFSFLGQGNVVIVWGSSWIHPIGVPMSEPLKLVHRMHFRRGKMHLFEIIFDTKTGAEVLRGVMQ